MFDYIIIGAGSAGCVVAGRLSARICGTASMSVTPNRIGNDAANCAGLDFFALFLVGARLRQRYDRGPTVFLKNNLPPFD